MESTKNNAVSETPKGGKEAVFDIGQKVWMMYSNTPKEYEVKCLVTTEDEVMYGLLPLEWYAEEIGSFKQFFNGVFKGDWRKEVSFLKDLGNEVHIPLYHVGCFYVSKESLISSL